MNADFLLCPDGGSDGSRMKNSGGMKASGMSGCGSARVLTHAGRSAPDFFLVLVRWDI